MFHLEFQQNQNTSNNRVPEAKVVTEVKPCNNNKEVQGKCEREFNESKANKPIKKLQIPTTRTLKIGSQLRTLMKAIIPSYMNPTRSYWCSYVSQKTNYEVSYVP